MSPPFVKYRRCCYEMAKEYFNPAHPHTLGWWQLGHIPYFILASQLLLVSWIMYRDFPPQLEWYSKYDVLLCFCRFYSNRFDAFMPFMLWLFVVLYHVLEYLTWRIDVTKTIWLWWYDMMVTNQDIYYQCVFEETKQKTIIKRKVKYFEVQLRGWTALGAILTRGRLHQRVLKMVAQFVVFYNFENVDQTRLYSTMLPSMPKLSPSIRRKLLLHLIVWDALAYGFQLFVVLLYPLFILANVFTYSDWSFHPILARLYLFICVNCTFYGTQRMIRYIVFYIGDSVFCCIAMTGQVIEARKMLEELLKRCSKANCQLIPLNQKWIVDEALSQHLKLCKVLMDGNEQIFGQIVYWLMVTQIPANVYYIRRLIFNTNSPMEMIVFWVVIYIQLLIGFGGLIMVSWCSAVFHRPAKLIPKLQSMMRGPAWRMTKLKYDDLYGRLIRGPKIALTFGPLNAVTYLTSFELLFTYVAYLLMAFTQVISGSIM